MDLVVRYHHLLFFLSFFPRSFFYRTLFYLWLYCDFYHLFFLAFLILRLVNLLKFI
jgi:hypothetical protein